MQQTRTTREALLKRRGLMPAPAFGQAGSSRILADYAGAFTAAAAKKKASESSIGYIAIGFCLLHIPLAILMFRYSALSTLHAVGTLGLGICWAITEPKRPEKVAYVGAYIMGAEVLWRMTGSQVVWEFGKYATTCIFLLAIIRSGRFKGPLLMFGYFALLVPSIAVTVERLGPIGAREFVSFNMSGPLAMMAAAWFFSQLKLSLLSIQKIFLAAVGPVVGIAGVTFFGIYSATKVTFTGESNYIASGGFGPNQVSAALGLGALLALLIVLHGKTGRILRILMLVVMFFTAIQSALTFSRGGLYNAAGSVALASIYLLRDRRTRGTLVLLAIMVFALGSYVIVPRLDAFTGGALVSRFEETNSTNRFKIAMEELQIWMKNPVLGAGPGGSKAAGSATAHTEFTRLLGEHGIFGAGALLLLFLAAMQAIRRARTASGKATGVGLVAWSFLYMLNAAMRLVAPAFMFGLAFALLTESVNPTASRPRQVMRRRRVNSRQVSPAKRTLMTNA